ncbi:MAG: 30S ribosomal protein S16 [Malacoplasma sp.]|nr:30S ribosomal protein S16 [Malacoplasma sp.]MDE5774971.1 30S ribosomal protein S16 [Malacoplasma sp.]MDE7100110.1 30S ribosomal protein S16 [Malacoplasma sp.]
MVKIRLTRLGRHKLPYFRMIAIDSRSRRDGAYIKQVGTYEPLSGKVSINEDDVLLLLNQGAQPTDTVKNFLKQKGIWKKFMESKLNNKKNQSKPEKKIIKKPASSSKPTVKKQTKK